MATIIRPKTREEWLEYRKTGIGSSEVGTILGFNPFDTPRGLWLKKTGQVAPEPENTAMLMGHLLEDAVAQRWSIETGRSVIKRSSIDWIIRDDDKPYLQVSPDRTYWIDPNGKRNSANKGILECKTTVMPVDPDDIPTHWYCQVMYQLGVAGISEGSIAWLTQGRDFGYKDIKFDQSLYEEIIEQVDRFYIDNIIGGKEPDLINLDDVLSKYPTHTSGKSIEVEDDVYEAWNELRKVRIDLETLNNAKEKLEMKVKEAFRDAEAITYGNKVLATFKAPKASTKFNQAAFAAAHPELVQQFTMSYTPKRRFLIK